MNKDLRRQIAVIAAVVVTIVVNGLANALPINGKQTGQISDQFDVYFVPAGYVFAIWGLIYVGLIAYAVFQALPPQRENLRLRKIGLPFIVASVANVAWIFLWHYEILPATILAMGVLLLALIDIYLLLGVGRGSAGTAERWLVHLPFSIYLGWITVATIANATSLLDFWKWGGFGIGEQAWTVIMLGVALVVAALMALTRRDVAYQLVLAWAFAGIALKHAAVPAVTITAWIATVVVLLLALISARQSPLRRRPLETP